MPFFLYSLSDWQILALVSNITVLNTKHIDLTMYMYWKTKVRSIDSPCVFPKRWTIDRRLNMHTTKITWQCSNKIFSLPIALRYQWSSSIEFKLSDNFSETEPRCWINSIFENTEVGSMRSQSNNITSSDIRY